MQPVPIHLALTHANASLALKAMGSLACGTEVGVFGLNPGTNIPFFTSNPDFQQFHIYQ